MVVRLIWYANVLAQLYLIASLVHKDLVRRYWPFLVLLVALTFQAAILLPLNPNSWDYARVWAACELVVSVCRIAAAGHFLYLLTSAYRGGQKDLWLFWRVAGTITIAGCMFATWAGLDLVDWNQPLFVQLTFVGSKSASAAIGTSLITALAWYRFAPNYRVVPNVATWIAIGAVYFSTGTIERVLRYVVKLNASVHQTTLLVISCACFVAWAVRLTPRGERQRPKPVPVLGWQQALRLLDLNVVGHAAAKEPLTTWLPKPVPVVPRKS